MNWLVLILGLALAVGGSVAIYLGADIVQLERGWVSVLAGAMLASGGVVTFALGLVLFRLDGLRRAFAEGAALRLVPIPARHEPDNVPVDDADHPAHAPTAPAMPAILAPAVAAAGVAGIASVMMATHHEPAGAAHHDASVTGEASVAAAVHEPHAGIDIEPQTGLTEPPEALPGDPAPHVEATAGSSPHTDMHVELDVPTEANFDPRTVADTQANWHSEPDVHAELDVHPEMDMHPKLDMQAAFEGDWLDRALSGVGNGPLRGTHHLVLATADKAGGLPAELPPDDAPPLAEPVVAAEPEVHLADIVQVPQKTIVGRYQAAEVSYVMYNDGSIDADDGVKVRSFKTMADLKAHIAPTA